MKNKLLLFGVMYFVFALVSEIIQSAAFHKDIPYQWWMGHASDFFACAGMCCMQMWMNPQNKTIVFTGTVVLYCVAETFELTGHSFGGLFILSKETQGITFDILDIATYIVCGIYIRFFHWKRE